jgi:signal transduction histidine kinase
MARDLHDSTGQTLTALKLSIAFLQQKLNSTGGTCDDLSGITRLADQALREIRTTSYLLHPPLLDEAGFSSAAQWYLDGFAERSGLKLHIDFAPECERMPGSIEIALFRVLQESLTNVHRHSETSVVDICFRRESNAVILEVRDYGRGMPKKLLGSGGLPLRGCGVGLAGMRERLKEVKGRLEIEAGNPGTMLRAIVPVRARRASAHAA